MTNPVYIKVVEGIKNKVNSAELQPGDAIPSEMALSKEYGTSRMTVRKGLAILTNENYIYSIPGKGYFVQKPELNKYTIYYDEMNNAVNSVDKVKLIEVNIVVPDEKLVAGLQITKNKKVVVIRRLFYTDGEPVAYDVKYLLYYKGMPIVEKEIENATFSEMLSGSTSLFALKKKLSIYARIPNEETKKFLNIYNDIAILVLEQKIFSSGNNKPMGMGITYFRGDYIKLNGISE